MKKLILLIALFASPVFAQEEEQEVQIEIETGGGVEVAVTGENNRAIAAFPDKSVWFFDSGGTGNDDVFYCYINDDGNPRCEEVDIDNEQND